jgi:adenine-specific DNA methylase
LRTTYDFYQNLNCEFDDVFEGWSEQTKRRWFNHINAPYKDAIRKCIKRQKKEKNDRKR